MKKEHSYLSDGRDLYIIECENPREKAAVRNTVAKLEIPAIELADRESVFTQLVLRDHLYRQCPQGNDMALSGLTVFESPKGIVYSSDQVWMAAIAIGIVRQA